ncbi:SPFH domain-containing protein [Streptomyces sp. O3]
MQEQTYDPVLEVAEPPKWRLTSPLRPPDPGHALVLVRDSGPALTIRSGEEIPSARYGGYRSVFTVDLGEHRLVLDIPLLSRDPTFSFRSRVDLVCKVADPARIVARGIRDMSGALYGYLRRTLREVARDYDVAEFHEAEQALNTALAAFSGDDAVRLRNIHVELLVDEDEIAASGREFRDVVRETRLAGMRRARHVDMIREEGVDGLIAEIMEREGPRAALAWIEKGEAEKREVRREVMRMILERGDSDREPFEQTELERAVLHEVLRDGDGLFETATRRGRLRGSLSRSLEPAAPEPAEREPEKPDALGHRGDVRGAGPGARGASRVFRDTASGDPAPGDPPGSGAHDAPDRGRHADRDSPHRRTVSDAPPRRTVSDAPPEDEPLPPAGSATRPLPAATEAPKPKVSRVRGTAKRRDTGPGREPR